MTASPDPHDLVTMIAQQLGETEPGPRAQIGRVVRRLGADAALAFLQETQQIEAQGGRLLPDGSRRRTPGGVFFQLVKDRVSAKDRAAIFWRPQGQPGRAQPGAPPTPAARPSGPIEIPNTTGEARTVKLTIIGRPGPVAASKAGHILTTLASRTAPALPKGLPTPPSTPTTYTLYLTPKQWAQVAEALRDPEDVLIVEGFPAYDPALEGIAVFATNVTTKQLQQAKRAAEQQGT